MATDKTDNNSAKFSLMALVRSYRRWWPLIIVVTCLGTLAGILWVYRTQSKLNVCATLLITDVSKDTDLMNVAGMSSIFGSKVELDNQVEKMKSHDLLKGLVRKYDLNVQNIYNKNFIKREQKFLSDKPMELIAPEAICDTLTSVLVFKVRVNSDGLVSVKGKNHRKDVIVDVEDRKFPVKLSTLYGEFTLDRTPQFDAYVEEDDLPMKMTFIVSNYDFAAEDLSKSIMPTIPNKKADIIELSFLCPNREFGKKLLGDFIDEYNRLGIDADVDKARRVNEYLETRIAELHAAVSGKEAKAEAFARENNVLNPLGDSQVDYKISSELKKSILLAQTEIEKLNLIKSLLGKAGDDHNLLPVPAENQQIAELIGGYNLMVQQKMRLEIDAKPSNKALQAVVQQLDAYRENILVSIDNAVRNANEILSEVRRQKGGLDSNVKNLNSFTLQYADMMRDHEITNAIYLILLKEQEHNYMKMNNTLPTGIVIAAPHVMKKQPGLPKMVLVFLFFCISLAMVPGALYIWSLIDDRIGRADDVRKIYPDADVLGALPRLDRKQKAQGLPYVEIPDFKAVADDIAMAIQVSVRANAHPVVMVTSPRPGQGRTTLAVALASSLVASSRRVLLLELDIRDSSVASLLGLVDNTGVTDYVAGNVADVTKAVQHTSSGFDVLTAGSTRASSLAVLSSDELRQAVERLRQLYDIVIVDAPSARDVKDFEAVSTLADATVSVLRAGSANYADVRSVQQAGYPIVVNAVARPGILTLWK